MTAFFFNMEQKYTGLMPEVWNLTFAWRMKLYILLL